MPALVIAIGDTVSLREPGNSVWVAQVLELCTTKPPKEEDGNDPTEMRMTLRWMYSARDIGTEPFKKCKGIPKTVPSEIYFSNHVSSSGANSVDEIRGRAFLFSTKEDMKKFQMNRSSMVLAGDAVRIVRCCFDCTKSSEKSLRELEVGELDRLLDNPEMNPNEPAAGDDWSWVGRGEKEKHGVRVFYQQQSCIEMTVERHVNSKWVTL